MRLASVDGGVPGDNLLNFLELEAVLVLLLVGEGDCLRIDLGLPLLALLAPGVLEARRLLLDLGGIDRLGLCAFGSFLALPRLV